MPLKIAIMVSGRGSNMSAILQSIKDGKLDATCNLVVSNNPEAPALSAAAAFGVATAALSHKGMSRNEHEKKMLEILENVEMDFLVLAGYMRILSPEFLKPFHSFSDSDTETGYFRVINIHPSLLPAFPGANAYEDAFDYGVRVSGVTVHLVDEKVDHGPILAQETFPRLPEDTLESFKTRGLEVEHKLYPSVLSDIARKGLQLLPKRVHAEAHR